MYLLLYNLEFLTGFQKRRAARVKKAQDEKIASLLEEKKRIKEKKREAVEERLRQFEDGTFDDGLGGMATSETFELPSHTVTVTDVADVDYVGASGLMLGVNKAASDDEDEQEDAAKETDKDGKGSKHFRANGSIRRQWNPYKKTRNHWQLSSKNHKKPKTKESYDRMKRKLKKRENKMP
ncbi:hypothetical protein CAPTEDRAFT_222129 [Capitella teleta]|uniref:Nucleolar protein 12 n=1 Tax=Capitella teleta TaxID=283909 RepID=R7U4Y4_CAPTE|nr:hypothetical protein CAPTEDRAFT_222129 [Capitella teleta]|eukprot:ELU01009.1 hypothetical protein CAPTEDRAFT_222129 [Capitella teleta]